MTTITVEPDDIIYGLSDGFSSTGMYCAAAEIARFIDRQFDVELAAAQVRQRPSDCAPGLDMELKLIEESTR